MLTECTRGLFDFARVEGRGVVASFAGGTTPEVPLPKSQKSANSPKLTRHPY